MSWDNRTAAPLTEADIAALQRHIAAEFAERPWVKPHPTTLIFPPGMSQEDREALLRLARGIE